VGSLALTGGKVVTLTLAAINMTDAKTHILNADANAHFKVTPPATVKDTFGNAYAAGLVTESGATHTLDATAPALSTVNTSAPTNSGGTLNATASEKAMGYWIAVAHSATSPNPAQTKAGVDYGVTVIAHGQGALPAAAGSLALSGLGMGTAYDIYLVAEDAAGLLSAAVSSTTITTQAGGGGGGGGGACINGLGLTPQTGYHTPSAQEGYVAVAAATCGWNTSSDANWVTVTSGATGNGNGAVRYRVAANSGTASRSAKLTIGGTSFPVLQDGSVASGFASQIQTMYIGYFGRPADPRGLAYYANILEQRGGDNGALMDDFWKSAESHGLYTQGSVADEITQVYEFLFGRPAETGGVSYWANMVASGQITVPSVAYAVAYNAQAADTAILEKKRSAAQAFMNALDTPEKILRYQNNVAPVRAWLDGVVDDATLAAALTSMADLIAHL
jgi:hypothetical protein